MYATPGPIRRLAPAFGLFALAPFVGEFLLGNIAVTDIFFAVLLAPLYGGGALLVREIGRRTGGWISMVLLAAAYALVEEGLADQLLFNHDYAGHDYLTGPSYLPALGTSVEAAQTVLALHTVWSVCVPIALAEAFAGSRAGTPWLRRTGLAVTACGYAAGVALVFVGSYTDGHFLATAGQLVGVTAVVVALIVAALRVRRRSQVPGAVPAAWLVGLLAFTVTGAYWGPSVLIGAQTYEWVGVAVWTLAFGTGIVLVAHWSRRTGWQQRHTFALAAGATLTYVWTAFPVQPELGAPARVDLVSNVLFGALGIIILVLAGRRLANGATGPATGLPGDRPDAGTPHTRARPTGGGDSSAGEQLAVDREIVLDHAVGAEPAPGLGRDGHPVEAECHRHRGHR